MSMYCLGGWNFVLSIHTYGVDVVLYKSPYYGVGIWCCDGKLWNDKI